jgi:hypothetical protein
LSLFSSENLLRNNLTLELKGKDQLGKDENLFNLFNSYTDINSFNTITDPPVLSFPEENAKAQKGVFSNLMIYEAVLIAELGHGKCHDEIAKLVIDLFEKYPLKKCGLNYSYIFLLNMIIEEGMTDPFQSHFESIISLIEEKAINTELKDDELYDESELRNLLEMTKVLIKNSNELQENEREKLLKAATHLEEKIPLSLNIELR